MEFLSRHALGGGGYGTTGHQKGMRAEYNYLRPYYAWDR